MAEQNANGDGYFVAVPLEAEAHAATVETAAGMVELRVVGPVVAAVTLVFTRHEARDVAYRVIEASQQIAEED